MIVSIHQPSYFPWMGLLDKINKSELYVYLDTVQLADRAYQHRNIFLSNQYKEHMLTIPINKKNYRQKTIGELIINGSDWKSKHLKFFELNYKKHPYFNEIFDLLKPIYTKDYEFLSDFLFESMIVTLDIFKINTKIIKASDLNLDLNIKKENMIIEILKNVDTTIYLSGIGAKSYQKEENFLEQGIQLQYQEPTFLDYIQYKNKNFIKGLSSLDVAFNYGIDNSYKILGEKR